MMCYSTVAAEILNTKTSQCAAVSYGRQPKERADPDANLNSLVLWSFSTLFLSIQQTVQSKWLADKILKIRSIASFGTDIS